MLSIDQEENKTDEGKNQRNNAIESFKISAVQQKLFEGIEKTSKVCFFLIKLKDLFLSSLNKF